MGEIRSYLAEEAARAASREGRRLYDFHVLVARLTANPALHLFVQALTDLTQRQPARERTWLSIDDVHAAHVMIAEAIMTCAGALARHRMMPTWRRYPRPGAGARRPAPPCGRRGAARSVPPDAPGPSAAG